LSSPKSVYKKLPKRLPKSKGFSRYSLDFDGAEDYVDVADDPSLEGMNKLTVSAWINPDTKKSDGDFLVIADKDNVWRLWTKNVTGTLKIRWVVSTDTAGEADLGGDVPINTWTHVAGVYDSSDTGNEMKIYQNGVLQSTDTVAGTTVTTAASALTIGQYSSTYWFDGEITGLIIYTRALSVHELRYNMLNYHNPSKNGLVGWWRFQEGTGLTTHDESGTGNDGTLKPSNDPPIWRDVKKWELRSEAGL